MYRYRYIIRSSSIIIQILEDAIINLSINHFPEKHLHRIIQVYICFHSHHRWFWNHTCV
jgi:hypothetical protein